MEDELHNLMPGIPWSVKNQARMHKINNLPPYNILRGWHSQFSRNCDCYRGEIGWTKNEIALVAPHGIADILQMTVKPVPRFAKEKIF